MNKGINIFVSYSVRDGFINRNILNKIYFQLKSYGVIFIDMIHNHSEHPQKNIIHKLLKADVLVLLFTRGVLYSPWALIEILTAFFRRIPIFVIPKNKFNDVSTIMEKNIHKKLVPNKKN